MEFDSNQNEYSCSEKESNLEENRKKNPWTKSHKNRRKTLLVQSEKSRKILRWSELKEKTKKKQKELDQIKKNSLLEIQKFLRKRILRFYASCNLRIKSYRCNYCFLQNFMNLLNFLKQNLQTYAILKQE